jgi:hypothetical protein
MVVVLICYRLYLSVESVPVVVDRRSTQHAECLSSRYKTPKKSEVRFSQPGKHIPLRKDLRFLVLSH